METPSYPSEKFLALSMRMRLRGQPSPAALVLKWLLIGSGLFVAVGAILLFLAGYFYFFFDGQGGKTAKAAKPAEAAEIDPAKAKAAAPETSYVWVQLMPDGKSGTPGGRLVRTIGPKGGTCPTIVQGDNTFAMERRAPATRAAFPVLLCEFVLIENSAASIGSTPLPVRPDEPNDIIVLGDTGCRMVYWQVQPCRAAADWPFAKVAKSASREAGPGKSFILHVGDFHYREDPCIDSSTECGTSPFGDNWDTWRTEFFEPAKPLLLAAPWVIMRGNHEDCARAGAGWIFLFSLPGQYKDGSACDDTPAGYVVNIGKTEEAPPRPRILLVLDSSDERNSYAIKERCEQYPKLLEPMDKEGPEFWLALHQPLWGRWLNGRDPPAVRKPCAETRSALTAIRDKFDGTNRLARIALAGDTHAFQFFQPAKPTMPIQIIAGNGGTALDKLCRADAAATKTDDNCKDKGDDGKTFYKEVREVREPVAAPAAGDADTGLDAKTLDAKTLDAKNRSLTFVTHGFTVLHRAATTWTAAQFDSSGRRIVGCWFSEALTPSSASTSLDCDPVSNW